MAGIDPRYFYLTLGLLALCTVVGAILAYRLQREVNVDDAPPTEKELFSPLEKAYYSGLMNEDEFKRIQASMTKQTGGQPVTSKKSKLQFNRIPKVSEPAPEEEETEPEVDEPETEIDHH